MNSIYLSSTSKKKLESVVKLAKELGVAVMPLSNSEIEEIEDWRLLKKIQSAKKTGLAKREDVHKLLGIK